MDPSPTPGTDRTACRGSSRDHMVALRPSSCPGTARRGPVALTATQIALGDSLPVLPVSQVPPPRTLLMEPAQAALALGGGRERPEWGQLSGP